MHKYTKKVNHAISIDVNNTTLLLFVLENIEVGVNYRVSHVLLLE